MNFKRQLIRIYNIFSYLLFDPLGKIRQYRAIPTFIANYFKFSNQHKSKDFPLRIKDFYVTTADKYLAAGSVGGHYFFQDIWAATEVHKTGVKEHTDIGSRIDGFVAHLLPFCKVNYVDIRPLNSSLENLNYIQGSILELPFADNSIDSLSCLHVIEHIGLGRYGDPIDPEGHSKAAKELARVLKPGGKLYIGTPVGKQRICFDAHRVFAPETIKSIFEPLRLESFHLIDDSGNEIFENVSFEQAHQCRYGCGLFKFIK